MTACIEKIIDTCPAFTGVSVCDFKEDSIANFDIFNRWCKHEFSKTGVSGFVYALTVTSTDKDPNALLKVMERLMEIKCVLRIEGNIELTKQKMPHVHCTVRCDKYLNKRQLKSRLTDFFCLKKVKGEAGWNRYLSKDEESKELMDYLMTWNIKTPKFLFTK